MKLQELVVVESVDKFDLYIPHPYGHGFDEDPIQVGEVIPLEDGSEAVFLGISKDGKKMFVEIDGEKIEMDPEEADMKIVPTGTKP